MDQQPTPPLSRRACAGILAILTLASWSLVVAVGHGAAALVRA